MSNNRANCFTAILPCVLAAVALSQSLAAPAPQKPPPTGAPRTSNDPPGLSQGKLGQDIFIAIDHRDISALGALLKRGGDPNARNGLGFVPLYMATASHQDDAALLLLKAGAKLDAISPYGTPLCFAALGGNETGIRLFLARGAKVNATRADGSTPLMLAATSCGADVIRELAKRKANVNQQDNSGATPLHYAARVGRLEALEALLDAGAKVDSADSRKRTALMYAAEGGRADITQALLKRGANVNAKDGEGRTSLLLAASYGSYPEVVKLLLGNGADATAVDQHGATAHSIARKKGYAQSASLLSGGAEPPAVALRTPKEAVQSGVRALEASMLRFSQRTGCISCHQEGLGRIALGEVQKHGFTPNASVKKLQMERINGGLNALRPLHTLALRDPAAMKQVPLFEINEVTTGDAWILAGLEAQRVPANTAIGAMTMVLARQQSPQGEWGFSLPRAPMQSSAFTFTALSIKVLSAYAPQAYAKEAKERIARAKKWLLTAPVKNSEDRASRLLGLKWAGASAEERKKSVEEILADQKEDGGWAQLDGLQSDAYATGQALYALKTGGGADVASASYQRGAAFLIRTQDEDGSWFVNKRALAVNNYFDGGFPHGHSQYSSFNGSCWAVMALAETLASPQKQTAKAD